MTHRQQTTVDNMVGKKEIASNYQFLLFPQCFLLIQITVLPFVHTFPIISLFTVELEVPNTDIGKGLTNNTILDYTKLKGVSGDKTNVTQDIISVFGSVENVLKGENAHGSIFSFSNNVFLCVSCFLCILKTWDCVIKS